MRRRPPRSTRPDTLFPYTTLFRSRARARRIYTGEGKIVSVRLLTKAPQEMQSRKPPYWQVEFEGWNRPTLYLSPQTGELISRRHALWRVFDFAWMLHIMDYDERTDVNRSEERRVGKECVST